MSPSAPEDVVLALERALREKIEGEVAFTPGARALYASDASNYRHPPLGVVFPRTVEDVVAAHAIARDLEVPLLSRGGGTSLAGQGCNAALVLDFTRHLHCIHELDPERRRVRVEPGCILDALQKHLAPHGLCFGPDPSTSAQCTLGGMIGNNACGVHSQMAGRTSDNVAELEVLTYDGHRLTVGRDGERLPEILNAGGPQAEIYRRLVELRDRYGAQIRDRFPPIPRRVSGYNLDELLEENGFHVARALTGTEGTCATILSAVVELVPDPPAKALAILGFDDICAAADAIREVVEHDPIGCEGIDHNFVRYARRLFESHDASDVVPAGDAWLAVEMGGAEPSEAEEKAREVARGLSAHATVTSDPERQALFWTARKSALGAEYASPEGRAVLPGWDDAAVAPERLGGYLREYLELVERFGYRTYIYGHFGHGCVHSRMDFDLQSQPGRTRFREFVEASADLVCRHGGSLSGEHGDGQARGALLPRMFGPELVDAFGEFKRIWDPRERLNPGRVVDPLPVTSGLRREMNTPREEAATAFAYPRDGGSFLRATERCIGIGACRREATGLMCPSYKVTRDEKHSTRGRARLLREMLDGSLVAGGWGDAEVKEALDLCLACKGCKTDCPAQVDMATYKAEFLAQYYRRRGRPLRTYLFGYADRWIHLGSHLPRLVNLLAQAPGLRTLASRIAGTAPKRSLPRLAHRRFTAWFRAHEREPRDSDSRQGLPVVLFPDTFTNHLDPQIAQAAVRVLEGAGFRPRIPRHRLCCGRPLYDAGLLGSARVYLRRVLEGLGEEVQEGLPVVVLEPGCASVFRDELVELFPEDPEAQALSRQTVLLPELLAGTDLALGETPAYGRTIHQPHCHQRAVLGTSDEERLLSALSAEVLQPEPSCCGLAGAFGFHAGRPYEVSMACGERALFPAIRDASADTLIVADGFSCREQIRHGTGRRARHIAEVLDEVMAQVSRS